MKSIVVASSCACLVTSVAWSMAVLIFAEPPPALAEDSPRVHELEEAVQDLQRTVADMRRKVQASDEPQVWRMEEPERPVEVPSVDRSHEVLAAVQQKTSEINSLGRRVDGIEEYLRYGGDFNPEQSEPEILAQDLSAPDRATVVGWTLNTIRSGSYQMIRSGVANDPGGRLQGLRVEGFQAGRPEGWLTVEGLNREDWRGIAIERSGSGEAKD